MHPERPSLKSSALRGVRATLASRFVFEIGGFVSTLIVARLITPADLGRASVALTIPLAATILTYEGFASALVQRAEVTSAHWRTSMSLGIAVGAGLAALTALLAATLGQTVFDRETMWLVIITSPAFLLAGLSATSRARMQRELTLAQLVTLETASFVLGTLVSIALAAAGLGAYGLVIGAVTATAAEAFGGWRFVPPVRPKFDRRCASDIGTFGLMASIGGIAYVLRRNGPYAVLAAVTTPQATGLFARAFQASAENQAKLTGILLKISFPIMARATSLEETQRVRRRVVSSNALAVLPLLAILSVTANDVISLLYGDAWAGAAHPAQVLVSVVAATTHTSGAEAMSMARGRPGDVAAYNVVSLVTIVGAVWLAAPHGVMTVTWTCVGSYLLQLAFAQYFLIKRATGMPVRTLAVDAGPAVVCSVVVWCVGRLTYSPLANATPAFVSVAFAGVVGLVLYALTLRILWPSVFADGRRLLSELTHRTPV